MLSETVLLAKSLLSEYAASWAKQALFNHFYKCFKLPVSRNFWILSRYSVNVPQTLSKSCLS